MPSESSFDFPASYQFRRYWAIQAGEPDPGPDERPRPGIAEALSRIAEAKNTDNPFRAAFEAALPPLPYRQTERRWESLRIALAPKKTTKTLKPLD